MSCPVCLNSVRLDQNWSLRFSIVFFLQMTILKNPIFRMTKWFTVDEMLFDKFLLSWFIFIFSAPFNNNIYFLDTRSSPDDIIHENCWDTILQISIISFFWRVAVKSTCRLPNALSLLISSLYEPQNYSSLEIGPQVSVESVLSTDALPWQLRNKILFNQSRPILGGAVYLELSFLSCSSSIPKRSPDVPHLYDAFCFTKWLVYASYYLLWKYWMLE